MTDRVEVDVAIFGGGIAGSWLLDELRRRGHAAVLLEAHELGHGQTIASQGILHGGLKYTLSGLLSPAASAVREMPAIWRRCLAGERDPDLRDVRLRSAHCHLWHLQTLRSKVGMIGARVGLRVAPTTIDSDERPDVLGNVQGRVARLDEQVIEPATVLECFARRHRDALMQIDADHGLEFAMTDHGDVDHVRLIDPTSGAPIDLAARVVVFAAGGGNEALREAVGLDTAAAQRRPLHMVVARGDLPELNGHCVDGTTTRITVTTSTDTSGRTLWQVGGQIAEDGVDLDAESLVARAAEEVRVCLPGIELTGVEWSTYRIDRAESAASGRRPDDVSVLRDGNVVTAWPTKLVLAPALATRVADMLDAPRGGDALPADVAKPVVALPPWETEMRWSHDV